MKKQKIFSIITIISLLFISSCGPEPETTTASYYRFKNESGIDLTIKFYYNHRTYLDSIFLKVGEYSDEFRECTGIHCDESYFLFYYVDSLDIISYRDYKLQKRYKRTESIKEKNPFNISHYSYKTVDFPGIYVYSILSDDFKWDYFALF